MTNSEDCYWSTSPEEQLRRLNSSAAGLTSSEAARRLAEYGPNRLRPGRQLDWLSLLLAQFKSPITLILIGAAGLSFFLHDPTDAVIILVIVLVSGLLGFWQEHSAANALQKLLAIVTIKANVLRDGREIEIPLENVAPGDVILVSAGSAIPGDCLILESKDLFVDEATLTGETYPVEKQPAVLAGGNDPRPPNELALPGHARCQRHRQSRRGAHGSPDRIRQGVGPPATSTTGNRFRAWSSTVRLLSNGNHIVVGALHFRGQRAAPAAGARFLPVLAGPGGGPDAAIAAGNHQRKSCARGQANGRRKCHCAAALVDRELRQHGRPLFRQDRHADRRE